MTHIQEQGYYNIFSKQLIEVILLKTYYLIDVYKIQIYLGLIFDKKKKKNV